MERKRNGGMERKRKRKGQMRIRGNQGFHLVVFWHGRLFDHIEGRLFGIPTPALRGFMGTPAQCQKTRGGHGVLGLGGLY